VLEEGRLRRLGGRSELEVDVRVLSATNRDLPEAIRSGRFREDLFFRLQVFQIPLPPLRERREDIPMLVQHFLDKFSRESAKRVTGVEPQAMEVLRGHDWPGNIRELRNTLERAVILCETELLTPDHLPPEMAGKGPDRHLFRVAHGMTLDSLEKEYILASLKRNGNNKARTAEMLGVSEKTLYNKLNRYGREAKAATGVAGPSETTLPPLASSATVENS